ncbi:hypothetical protein C0J52_20090 [Blattella germanica]|nr:hypothetical protein C0J52_20090 [Blattella germanica]
MNIISSIEIERLQWAVLMKRMDDESRSVILSHPEGNRVRGRLKSRWEDNMELNAGSCGARNWKSRSSNRKEWNSLPMKELQI